MSSAAPRLARQQMANRLRREGEFAPCFVVQNPDDSEPSEDTWRKNYVVPKSFRDACKAGRGYRWFKRALPRYRVRATLLKVRSVVRKVLRK